MREQQFRQNLIELLKGGQAHASVKDILEGIHAPTRNTRPIGMQHTIWELLEHLRLAQEDILRYTLNPNWVSPPFPEGYWHSQPNSLTEADWQQSVTKFFADLEELIKLVEDDKIDLTSEIPHSNGHTYLREILLVADHNSYHLGQILQIRKALGDWHE